MARRKKTPETSRIARVSTVAYARKQKPEGPEGPNTPEGADDDDADTDPGLDAKFDMTDRSQPMRVLVDPEEKAEEKPGAKPPPPPPPRPRPAKVAATVRDVP